jgi:hypothetical protein
VAAQEHLCPPSWRERVSGVKQGKKNRSRRIGCMAAGARRSRICNAGRFPLRYFKLWERAPPALYPSQAANAVYILLQPLQKLLLPHRSPRDLCSAAGAASRAHRPLCGARGEIWRAPSGVR